jgi:hypothetical protein
MVEWLTFLLRIREVPDLNLAPENGYPGGFSWIYLVHQAKFWVSISKLCHDCFVVHSFQIIIHLPHLLSTL